MLLTNTEIANVANDLYFVPYKDDLVILYRPSIHSVSLVNKNAASKISEFLNGVANLNENDSIIAELADKGIFFPPQEVFSTCTPLISSAEDFAPTEVTLDITWRCNLRCVYCYANAGEESVDMDWDCAISAIDLCINNSMLKNKPFVLRFHGNGEATQNWKMLKELVEYGKRSCESNDVPFSTSIATNGIVNKQQARWISDNIDAISLSYDGDIQTQNSQRPTLTGKTSAQIVEETMSLWVSLGKQFNVRMTVTNENVNKLTENCIRIGKMCPQSLINVEPMVICGRANESSELAPDPEVFATNYAIAFLAAADSGIRVSYSGMRGFTMRRFFCGASMPNFSVLADGRVTSCFSYSSQDFRRDLFVYGQWVKDEMSFDFDLNVISQLRNLSVEHDSYCDNCFVKYHCTGDCPAIRKYELTDDEVFVEKFDVDFGKNRRCKINRTIMKDLLISIIEHEGVTA